VSLSLMIMYCSPRVLQYERARTVLAVPLLRETNLGSQSRLRSPSSEQAGSGKAS